LQQFQEFISEVLFATDLLNRNLSRAGELISNFKQLALDQHADQRRQFSLNEIASDSIRTMAQQLRSTDHTIELTITDDIIMDSYPLAISKILLQFISNAMIHGFEGLEQGQMLLHAEIQNENYVRITFNDNGVGMPPKVLRRVFEPFFTTRMGSGSNGLGMHLVYNMVTQLLGGQIEIKSVLGHGTTIILEIPLQAPVSASDCARIGAPADVIDDFARFLNGRDILNITSFEGPTVDVM